MSEEKTTAELDRIYMKGTLGDVEISDEVVAVIAGIAAMEVEGVESMSGSGDSLRKDIISRLGMKVLSKGVHIDVEGTNVRVGLAINLEHGYNIPDVAKNVQEKVKSEIENMTGLVVSEVDVRIDDVELDNE